jgi:hypothetical protein
VLKRAPAGPDAASGPFLWPIGPCGCHQQSFIIVTTPGEGTIMTRRLALLALAALGSLAFSACDADPVRPENKAPVVTSLSIGLEEVYLGDDCPVDCVATDPDGDPITFHWAVGSGHATGSGSGIVYTPTTCCTGGNPVIVTVRDARGAETRAELFIRVIP